MADKVQFELVSPERLLKSEPVDMVVVPGADGYFGVLPQHAPFISTLRAGVIDIHDGGKVAERIFVAGGVAEVNETSCTVLAEEAWPVNELSRDLADRRLTEARAAAEQAQTDQARAAAASALETANAMLAALENAPTAH